MDTSATTMLTAEGPWMDRLDAAFLSRLLGREFDSTTAACAAFAAEALRIALPLAAGLDFDAAYYREVNPAFATASDEVCYVDWLTEGLALGRAPNPAMHLANLRLALLAYPENFAWEHYGRRRPQAGAHRWAALDDLCTHGFAMLAETLPFNAGDFQLLLALGIRFSVHDDALAIRAYELARSFAAPPSAELQHLADAYLRSGLWRPALTIYIELIEAGTADGWTLRNLIQAASRLGRWEELEAAFGAAASGMARLPDWPDILHNAMTALHGAKRTQAAALLAAGHVDEARVVLGDLTTCLMRWTRLLPALDAAAPGTVVLIVAELDETGQAPRHLTDKAMLLAAAGRACEIASPATASAAVARLDGIGALILSRATVNAGAMLLAGAARQRRIPIFYEDEVPPEEVPALDSFRGLLPAAEHEALRLDAWSRAAALAMADAALAPTPALVEVLAARTLNGRGFCVPDHVPAAEAVPERPDVTLAICSSRLLFLDAGPDLPATALLALLRRWPEVTLAIQGPVHLDTAFDAHAGRIRLGDNVLQTAVLTLIFSESDPQSEHLAELAWAEAAALAVPAALLAPEAVLPHLRHDDVLLRAAQLSSWLACVEAVLQDVPRRRRLGAAARQAVVGLHGAAAVSEALQAALRAERD